MPDYALYSVHCTGMSEKFNDNEMNKKIVRNFSSLLLKNVTVCRFHLCQTMRIHHGGPFDFLLSQGKETF